MESLARPKFDPSRRGGPSAVPEASRPGFSRLPGAGEPTSAPYEPAPESPHLERLLIREQGRLVVVRVAEVDWIEGAGNYVRFHLGATSFLYRQTLAQLEARLDPLRFARIHRSTIVNLDRIAELRPTVSGAYEVVLLGGQRLVLSRGHRKRALQRVGPA